VCQNGHRENSATSAITTIAQTITAAWIARHDPKIGGAPPSTHAGWGGSGALVGGVVLVSGWVMAGTPGGSRPRQPLCDNLAVITGFNTDVKYRGLVYHVQTEDKGRDNPLIETLIYKGGEILASRRLPYSELVKETDAEKTIAHLMEEQHKAMILEVKRGKFAPPEDAVVEDLSLDEIVLAYLQARFGAA
jgi:hypothetical protein